MSNEYTIRNGMGQIVTIVHDRRLAFAWLKQESPDGDYSIEGPGLDMTYYRVDGVLYPSGGTIDGQRMPPRSRAECVETFGPTI